MNIFGPGLSHLPARAGKLGRVIGIWAGPDENGPGRVLCIFGLGFRHNHRILNK